MNSNIIPYLKEVKQLVQSNPKLYEWHNPVRDNVGLLIQVIMDISENELRDILIESSPEDKYYPGCSWRIIVGDWCEGKFSETLLDELIIKLIVNNDYLNFYDFKYIEYYGEEKLDYIWGDFSVQRYISFLDELIADLTSEKLNVA